LLSKQRRFAVQSPGAKKPTSMTSFRAAQCQAPGIFHNSERRARDVESRLGAAGNDGTDYLRMPPD